MSFNQIHKAILNLFFAGMGLFFIMLVWFVSAIKDFNEGIDGDGTRKHK